MKKSDFLAYYSTPGMFTGIGRLASEIDAIPDNVADITRVVQGLLIHEAWAPAYGVTFPGERTVERQLHGADAMFALIKRLNPGPLTVERPPIERVVGVCRHFATLSVACMRSKGVPSRVRCGFGNHFAHGG